MCIPKSGLNKQLCYIVKDFSLSIAVVIILGIFTLLLIDELQSLVLVAPYFDGVKNSFLVL